jgi:hypothetical protein
MSDALSDAAVLLRRGGSLRVEHVPEYGTYYARWSDRHGHVMAQHESLESALASLVELVDAMADTLPPTDPMASAADVLRGDEPIEGGAQ